MGLTLGHDRILEQDAQSKYTYMEVHETMLSPHIRLGLHIKHYARKVLSSYLERQSR